jgi:hypothetical protein
MTMFQSRHFAGLSPSVAERLNNEVPVREEIRNLLLDLDDAIPPAPFPQTAVLGLDLHRHWSSEHRTALWFPHQYNGLKVDEIYLRYGKSRAQVRALANLIPPAPDEPPDLGGFPAHAHIAIGLSGDFFFFQLVLGPKAWLDLHNMRDLLSDPSPDSERLFADVMSLGDQGYRLFWGPEERQVGDFSTARDLGDFIRRPQRAVPGRDWFVVRRDLPPQGGTLRVPSQDLQTEILRLWPVFDMVALRRPPAI